MRDKSLFNRASVFTAGWILLLTAGVAHAQLPNIRVSGPEPSVFEGDPNTAAVTLDFTVQLSSVSTQDVTVLFSTFPFANNAVSGTSCATANLPDGADFIGVTNRLVTIPANANPAAVTVSVTTCRDDQVEFHPNFANQTREDIGVMLTSPVNAVCNGSECLNVGHIFDDDGPPFAGIGNATVREPLTGSRLATFTVGLSHPHPGSEVRVGWATRNGTARAVSGSCSGLTDFLARSGTLVFPSEVRSATLTVPVCADAVDGESTESFFVDLTGGQNVVTSSVAGTGSILEAFTLALGTFSLDPEGIDVRPEEWVRYRFGWTLSTGVWRDLHSMELRVRQRDTGNVALWIRWVESSNTFQLCEGPQDAQADSAARRCDPPVAAGAATVLASTVAQLDVSGTTVAGSGPAGPSVMLEMPISFGRGAANRVYDVEVAAEGDNGVRDDFVAAGVLIVGRPARRE